MAFSVQPELKYTHTHEWVRVEGESGTAGITAFAQHELGDVVYVDLPQPGESFGKGETFGSCESVKAVADLKMPAGGEITAVNEELVDHPEWVNEDPYGKGWMVKIRLAAPAEADSLLDAGAYQALTGGEKAA